MQQQQFTDGLLAFLDASPSPFHAVQQMTEALQQQGFSRLDEAEAWSLAAGGRYFVSRNDSSLIAFRLGSGRPAENGLQMVGAHTDSPCLRVKPNPLLQAAGCMQLGVEVYGGALLNPWFDRDLSLAGRVTFARADAGIDSRLIDFRRPIAVIPSLAIHLDRKVNDGRKVNAQLHLAPLLSVVEGAENPSFHALLLQQLLAEHPECGAAQILDQELGFYDTQPAARVGLNGDFITAARLDNLLSCYTGMMALLAPDNDAGAGAGTGASQLLVCNDHEEVGSQSAIGAQGPFLKSVLQRLCGDHEGFSRAMQRSMMISADNAHAMHPNFTDKHDGNHGPLLNAGPVIKVNANQRYASNSTGAARFRQLCQQAGVPVQSFVTRSDMACGSTIGPITASQLGVQTLDIGVPTLAMHSVRELAGSDDAWGLYRVLTRFYR